MTATLPGGTTSGASIAAASLDRVAQSGRFGDAATFHNFNPTGTATAALTFTLSVGAQVYIGAFVSFSRGVRRNVVSCLMS